MHKHLSGDVVISGPSHDPAENLVMMAVKELEEAHIETSMWYRTDRVGATICLESIEDKPEAYALLSRQGYHVNVVPGNAHYLRLHLRQYAAI